jgi:hypothetical protein
LLLARFESAVGLVSLDAITISFPMIASPADPATVGMNSAGVSRFDRATLTEAAAKDNARKVKKRWTRGELSSCSNVVTGKDISVTPGLRRGMLGPAKIAIRGGNSRDTNKFAIFLRFWDTA